MPPVPTPPDDAEKIAQAAALLGVSRRSLAAWLAEYRREHGEERRGRPRTEVPEELVREAAEGRTEPQAVAYLLGKGYEVSRSTLRRRLEELGMLPGRG